jgi:hypothetical protein
LLGLAEPIRAVANDREAFAGIDVAKLKNAIAIADSGREGEVRFFGEVDASDESMRELSSGSPSGSIESISATRPVQPAMVSIG